MGGSGRPGTVNPSQVLSMGEDLYKAATLSDEDVKKIGDESIAEMDSKNPVAPPNNPYAKRLARLSGDLKNAEGLNLDFKVYLVKDVNAFSLPNGSIRVVAALMDKMTDDELKFILGHEIAHIKNGHRKARLQRAYASSAAIKAANTAAKATTSSSVGGYAAVVGGDIAAKIAGEVINGQFSQSDETECDEYGLHLLASKNLPKDAAIKALLKLGDESGAEKSSTDLFASLTSSHPDPLERAKHLQAMIPELAGQPDLVGSKVQVAKNGASADEPTQHSAANAALPPSEEAALAPNDSDDHVGQEGAAPIRVASHHKNRETASANATVNAAHEGWYIQVGAFSNRASAISVHNTLAKSAGKASTQEGSVSGRRVYRVLVGPFDSRAQAEAGINTVLSNEPSISDAFVRRL
jgi:putative metalloprotease